MGVEEFVGLGRFFFFVCAPDNVKTTECVGMAGWRCVLRDRGRGGVRQVGEVHYEAIKVHLSVGKTRAGFKCVRECVAEYTKYENISTSRATDSHRRERTQRGHVTVPVPGSAARSSGADPVRGNAGRRVCVSNELHKSDSVRT